MFFLPSTNVLKNCINRLHTLRGRIKHAIFTSALTKTHAHLGLRQVLLAVGLAVLLLHEGDPAQLALLDEGLDVDGAERVATDALVVLEHEAVL